MHGCKSVHPFILRKTEYKECLNIIYYILEQPGYNFNDKISMAKSFINDLENATEHERRKLNKHVHYYIWGCIEYEQKLRKFGKENDITR